MPTPNDRMHGKSRTSRQGLPWGKDPSTADVTYTDEEVEWLKAIDRVRSLSGEYVDLRTAFRIFLSLGYRKAT